jgi:hypothetical protein
MPGPGVAPAARTMLRILSDVAREYRGMTEPAEALEPALGP